MIIVIVVCDDFSFREKVIPYARIVWIHRVFLVPKAPSELSILKEAYNHRPVDGVEALRQKLLSSLLVD